MKYKKVHCIGIGGIGISALARYYLDNGAIVSGSDSTDSDLIQSLRDQGIIINIGNDAKNIPVDADLIVYTIAIDYQNDVEYKEAKEREPTQNKVTVLSYAEALGELTRESKTIAICGTHVKTTTTAMAYNALHQAGLNPTLIVGSLIDHNGKKTNYIGGQKKDKTLNKNIDNDKNNQYLIIEACEYKRSFLNYESEYVLVTNIDEDHLDYYKDISDIRDAFREFASNINHMGCLIIHRPEEIVFTESIFIKNTDNIYTEKSNSKNQKSKIKKSRGYRLIIADDTVNKDDIKLSVMGDHNKSNAQLVVALGQVLAKDIYDNEIEKDKFNDNVLMGLKDFIGTWRRMEYKGHSANGAIVYDDYAHHPNEMIPTITTLREHYKDKKIVLVFQPHLQSRTKDFYEEFVDAMMLADIVYVLPVHHARAEHDHGINNYKIVASIIDRHRAEGKNIDECQAYTLDFDNAKEELLKYNNYHVIVTMGAGKNNIIANQLTDN